MTTPSGQPVGPVPGAAERARIAEAGDIVFGPEEAGPWHLWGPYLAERAWGTVREDYSADGDAWRYFPYDQARSRAYRWSEDGIAGLCDIRQDICLSVGLWNGRDPHLKERFFGLDGHQGNHGEDAKEYWWYRDAAPSHAWLSMRYHYPQGAYPYERLVAENAARDRSQPEFELIDTGIFDGDRYWKVDVDYAKASPTDISMRIRVTNMGPDPDTIHVLPAVWFRNDWDWGSEHVRPIVEYDEDTIVAEHWRAGRYHLEAAPLADGTAPTPVFCDNETNTERLFGDSDSESSRYPKDGINDHVVNGADTVNPDLLGTKAAWWYRTSVEPGATVELRLRWWKPEPDVEPRTDWHQAPFDELMEQREAETAEFYRSLAPASHSEDELLVMRRAFAGMVWGKQFYRYDVSRWLTGDPGLPPPPPEHRFLRNANWKTLDAYDVLSMPDPWEYPWFAAWDLAFHSVVFAHIDPDFAKYQLNVMLREWYMHPNGALPAYEWNFDDINPPVHAWAAIRVFEIEGGTDVGFLTRVFHKLLLNFTWWVNRVDEEGNNVFEGGFLGLDNIGPIDRSNLPPGYRIEQVDGTSWMAFYALMMLRMAIRLSEHDENYRPMVLKFLEHFASITDGMADVGMFDVEDGFFYDQLIHPDGLRESIRSRSIVGVIPVLAAAYITTSSDVPRANLAQRRFANFMKRRSALDTDDGSAGFIQIRQDEQGMTALLTIVDPERLRRVLVDVLSERSLLSDRGLRSLSRRLADEPVSIDLSGQRYVVDYEPAESTTWIYGGNSNWRGPVWFPLNHLVIEALERYHMYVGDEFQVECPTGSGVLMNLQEVADELRRRLISIFTQDENGHRPVFGADQRFQTDPDWNDPLFYEYFDGDTGRGLGASHQTGWTGLVADLIIGRRG
jgi:hypothetical protein